MQVCHLPVFKVEPFREKEMSYRCKFLMTGTSSHIKLQKCDSIAKLML